MGAGKSSIGKRLARRLGLPFVDADHEIEAAAGCSIPDIFELYGEAAFRDGERKVIARLLDGAPIVLATGGGAFLDTETQARVRERGVSVWLRAPLDVLVRRIGRRGGRPLLKGKDPREALADLMERRYPIYSLADVTVDTGDEDMDTTVGRVLDAIDAHRAGRRSADTASASAAPQTSA
jgi:shikimate kinase